MPVQTGCGDVLVLQKHICRTIDNAFGIGKPELMAKIF